jgi:hypothetical protein
MIKRSALLIVCFAISGCYLSPYYPVSPIVRLQKSNVSDIEIMPTASSGSVSFAAPNSVGTYNGTWNATGSGKYSGQWDYTGTNIQNAPPINNTGTLSCGDIHSKENQDIPETRECEVKKAIDYANAANDKYLKAQSQHADMPGVAALALLPAAGAATALGIEGIGSTAITGLGVGTATLLGLGAYLHPSGREAVYNTGSLGIQCMLDNMQPYTSVNSNDLSRLIGSIDSDHIPQTGAAEDDLSSAKTQLDLQIVRVEALGLQKDCNRLPRAMKFASLLLKAAKAADKSAEKTIQVGNEFAHTALAAPITIVNTTNHINAAVNEALITTEPNLSDLAGKVKSTIPDQAVGLAGLPAATAAASSAQVQMQNATAGQGGATTRAPATAEVVRAQNDSVVKQNIADEKTKLSYKAQADADLKVFTEQQIFTSKEFALAPESSAAKKKADDAKAAADAATKAAAAAKKAAAEAVREAAAARKVAADKQAAADREAAPKALTTLRLTRDENREFNKLQDSLVRVNDLVNDVISIVGSETGKVDNSKCPILAKKSGIVTSMKLDPDGDIVYSAQSAPKITIKGAIEPYVRPLFPQSVCSAVTATLKADEIDIAATSDTTPGFYPFFVGDGAIGKVFNVMVPMKAPADDTDDVQVCQPAKKGKPADPGYVPPPPKDDGQGKTKYVCPPALVLTQPTAGTPDPAAAAAKQAEAAAKKAEAAEKKAEAAAKLAGGAPAPAGGGAKPN